jgi:hypothetical protein
LRKQNRTHLDLYFNMSLSNIRQKLSRAWRKEGGDSTFKSGSQAFSQRRNSGGKLTFVRKICRPSDS